MFTFGWGQNGALGNGSINFSLTPYPVDFFNDNKVKVKDVVAGESYTLAVTGKNDYFYQF